MQSLEISTAALRGVQYALDATANNLANIDTVGYKRRGATFSELLTDSMNEQPVTDTQRTSPKGLRIGSGVKVGLTPLDMSQGNAKNTDVPTDLMIEGEGFFLVSHTTGEGANAKEEYRLTRNGAFHISPSMKGNDDSYNLVTANGDILVDDNGLAIDFPKGDLKIMEDGRIFINGQHFSDANVNVWNVDNPEQYKQIGENEYALPIDPTEKPSNVLTLSSARIRQGALETSNVDMRKEMSQMLLIQRAYQLNSRAIGIADQMMGIANSIRSR